MWRRGLADGTRRRAIGRFARRAFGYALALASFNACHARGTTQKPAPDAASTSATPSASAPASASAARRPARPLDLSTVTRSGRALLIDSGPASEWLAQCKIHRACPPSDPLPQCGSALSPLDSIAEDELGGRPVVVRGTLFLGSGMETAVSCRANPPQRGRPCCNGAGRTAIIVVGGTPVSLTGLGCGGDESRECCGVPALGQRVIASGYLGYAGHENQSEWRLRDAKLCVEQTPAAQ